MAKMPTVIRETLSYTVSKQADVYVRAPASSKCRFQKYSERIISFLSKSGKQQHSFPVQIQFKFLPFPFRGNSTATQGKESVMLYYHQLLEKKKKKFPPNQKVTNARKALSEESWPGHTAVSGV